MVKTFIMMRFADNLFCSFYLTKAAPNLHELSSREDILDGNPPHKIYY